MKSPIQINKYGQHFNFSILFQYDISKEGKTHHWGWQQALKNLFYGANKEEVKKDCRFIGGYVMDFFFIFFFIARADERRSPLGNVETICAAGRVGGCLLHI